MSWRAYVCFPYSFPYVFPYSFPYWFPRIIFPIRISLCVVPSWIFKSMFLSISLYDFPIFCISYFFPTCFPINFPICFPIDFPIYFLCLSLFVSLFISIGFPLLFHDLKISLFIGLSLLNYSCSYLFPYFFPTDIAVSISIFVSLFISLLISSFISLFLPLFCLFRNSCPYSFPSDFLIYFPRPRECKTDVLPERDLQGLPQRFGFTGFQENYRQFSSPVWKSLLITINHHKSPLENNKRYQRTPSAISLFQSKAAL